MKKYEKLAEEIAESIRTGVLRKGDKLPSVRQASASHAVNASTVFEAYYLLEARGLITVKERSGYYVSGGSSSLPELAAHPVAHPYLTPVDVSELVFDILGATRNRTVVPLGSAFPSPLLFPLKKLGRTMASIAQHMDPWSSVRDLSPGDENLRRQIAVRYMIDGFSVPTDDIVITNGALEALNLCLAAVSKPGDSILIECPTFYAALQAIERNGLNAIEIPSHPKTGVNLDAMAAALEQHKPAACWLMTNFQNPLGSLMPEDKKQALVALLQRYQVPLIEDDVYGELYFGQQRPKPAKAFDTEGLVMHCSSFSKCLAPGYRVGWVAAGRFAKTIERIKLTTTLAAPAPVQQTLAAYLAMGGYDRHLRALRHTLLMQQIRFIETIEQVFPAGTQLTRPAGGYFLWLKLPEGTDALSLHQHCLELGISIAPGPMFSAQRQFSEYIRLNYGHEWTSEIEQALHTLARLIPEHIR
ncbi:aminotransferase-like domain-containing protein [Methylovorus sp. SPW-M1]